MADTGNDRLQGVVGEGGEAEGNTISLGYSYPHGYSELSSVTDTHGHELTVTRNPWTNYVTKMEGPAGKTWEYGYNGSHELTSYKGPESQSAEYGYYSGSEMLKYIIDPSGTYVICYDEYGRVVSLRKVVNGSISTEGSEDEVTHFSYSAESTVVKHPDGSEQTYYYDEFGNELEEPATQEAASEFYGGYAEIGSSTATADVKLQDHASILDSQLSQQLGSNYVGEWFEPSTGHLRLGIAAGGYEQTVERDLDNLGLAETADIVAESASWGQITAAYGTIGASPSVAYR